MIGHWGVYKRTPLKSLQVIDHNVLLKSMLITGRKPGFVFSDVNKRDDPSWTIVKLDKDHQMECEGLPKRTFKVIKCQSGEVVLEDEEMRYFFRYQSRQQLTWLQSRNPFKSGTEMRNTTETQCKCHVRNCLPLLL